MARNIIVYDDFYKNLDSLRESILQNPFKFYPSKSFARISGKIVCSDFDKLANSILGKHTVVDNNAEYYGDIVAALKDDSDTKLSEKTTDWGCVVFLTPEEKQQDSYGINLFDEKGKAVFIPGAYNRAVFFRSKFYELLPQQGFGDEIKDSKMYQLFFFGEQPC